MRIIFSLALLAGFQLSVSAQKLVLPGDYPDPSVVKIGDTYWASATTSNWFPAYPLLQSKDLVNWKTSGYIFNQKPEWADYYFWAPEMTYDNGKVYVYYSAHKKGGNLCVGVASADKPEGPYKDLGTLICEAAGSIDAFPMRDEAGKLHLIWKEDGNSIKQPTPIWIQEMNEDRTGLVGRKKELFRNDAPWEANLVEGVSMIKHGGYYYAIYAAAGCCGPGCNYNTGVARSKNLMGPWEKDPRNPVLENTSEWKCPGHGTAVEKDGKFYFLYHAYNTKGDVFVGRQGLLSEFKFNSSGWIDFVKQAGEGNKPAAVNDGFSDKSLSHLWQWSVFQDINKRLKKGRLELTGLNVPTGAFIGQSVQAADYTFTVNILTRKSSADAGIGIFGDEKNNIYALVKGDSLMVIEVKDNKEKILSALQVDAGKRVSLQGSVTNGSQIAFKYSRDGSDYIPLDAKPVDGSYLPPWDRGLRVGLVSKGVDAKKGVFDDFIIKY